MVNFREEGGEGKGEIINLLEKYWYKYPVMTAQLRDSNFV